MPGVPQYFDMLILCLFGVARHLDELAKDIFALEARFDTLASKMIRMTLNSPGLITSNFLPKCRAILEPDLTSLRSEASTKIRSRSSRSNTHRPQLVLYASISTTPLDAPSNVNSYVGNYPVAHIGGNGFTCQAPYFSMHTAPYLNTAPDLNIAPYEAYPNRELESPTEIGTQGLDGNGLGNDGDFTLGSTPNDVFYNISYGL